jgi:hypothetical protein
LIDGPLELIAYTVVKKHDKCNAGEMADEEENIDAKCFFLYSNQSKIDCECSKGGYSHTVPVPDAVALHLTFGFYTNPGLWHSK